MSSGGSAGRSGNEDELAGSSGGSAGKSGQSGRNSGGKAGSSGSAAGGSGGSAGSSGGAVGSSGGAAGASGGSAGASGGAAGSSGGTGGSSGGSVGSSGGSAGHISGAGGSTGGHGKRAGGPVGPVGAEIQQKNLGAKPDVPDVRDYYYRPKIDLTKLPASVDLRPQCPPIYDQGLLGSCTANAIGAAIEFNQMKEHARTFTPSRLFIFYRERFIGGNINDPEKGASIRDGLKAVSQNGAPPEELWPYDEGAVCLEPPPEAFAAAKLDLVTSYNRVAQHLDHIKGCLAEGYPMVFCFQTYLSLPNPSTTGTIPMPLPNDEKDGWHAMMLVGYDDATGTFLVRNSWGTGWGMAGYGTMPYAYLLDTVHISDLWTIRGVTELAA